jgi:excisionase family DNA binding protein
MGHGQHSRDRAAEAAPPASASRADLEGSPPAPPAGSASPEPPDRTARHNLDVMTVEELAARLGVRPKTVYAAIRQRQIPGVLRVGRLVRISRPAVLRWLDGQDAARPRSTR